MSRSICIIGAGQAGLQLGLGLLNKGYRVKLYSNRSAQEILGGFVMSTQCMFASSLAIERDLGLNDWDDSCPEINGIALNIAGPDGNKALSWQARLNAPAQSVDQRLKFSHWLSRFTDAGGELALKAATLDDLEVETKAHDLVIVSAGKGEISGLFARNAEASPYSAPQRMLAMCYVHGMTPHDDYSKVSFNVVPGVGEYFTMRGLTTSGPCDYIFFETIPGSVMDNWADISTPQEHLARSLELLEALVPWEAERCRDVTLTDDKAVIRGKFPPTVRHPVGRLPSGRLVLGMGDTVVLNDPITGQGSNTSAKCAASYLEDILAHGDAPFDETWMHASFARFWDYAQWTTGWTNAMLQPPPEHVQMVLGAAALAPTIASAFVNGFDNPRDFFPWLADPAEAKAFVAQHAQAV